MRPISICVIMKNEEAHLDRFLSEIENNPVLCLFELILVDTGSTDNSVKIAHSHNISPYFYKWTNDFSAARNYAASLSSNDWVMALDCDEYPEKITEDDITIITSKSENTGVINRRNIFENAGEECSFIEPIPRIYNKNLYHFEGIIHEQLSTIDGNEKYPRIESNISFLHMGYVGNENTIKEKALRNKELLLTSLNSNSEDPYIYFQLGQAAHCLGNEAEACSYYEKGLSFDVDEHLRYVNMMVIAYGYALINTGRHEDALSFESIYDVFATTADFVCLMGLIYLRNEMLAEAINQFQKALTINDSFTDGAGSYIASYNLGVIYEVLGHNDEALRYYDACGDFAPAISRKKAITTYKN